MSGLYRLYIALTATPSKVLETSEEPITASVGEQRVFTYLQQFIGHMKIEEVQKFYDSLRGVLFAYRNPSRLHSTRSQV